MNELEDFVIGRSMKYASNALTPDGEWFTFQKKMNSIRRNDRMLREQFSTRSSEVIGGEFDAPWLPEFI